MIQASRRSFITGLISLAAAPAIVRASSLMPVKVMEPHFEWFESRFKYRTVVGADWRYVARIANIDTNLPGNPNLIGELVRNVVRAPPIVDFREIDLTDPLWALPKA